MTEAIFEENREPEFEVDNDQKAEWCIQKIREAKADKDFWGRFYSERMKAVNEAADATIAQMEALLMRYFGAVPHKKTPTQESYPLPSGKLVCKKQEPQFVRQDAETIDWLKKNGGQAFVKVEESLDWQNLKKAVTVIGEGVATAEGEMIPGIRVVPREDVFKVEVK